MNIYTYEPWTKQSVQSHDHATIRYANGTASILSRERTRSVARQWDVIGNYIGSEHNPSHLWLTEDSMATRMVATYMKRNGTRIHGIKLVRGEFGSITRLESDGRITNPESINGRIRNRAPGSPTDKRRKTQRAFGGIGQANVVDMRAAILTARAKRV